MIRNSLKKAVSVLMTGALLFGLAGCLGGGSKKAVIEAADALASDMVSASASKLIKSSTLDKKSDEAATLTELLDGSDYSDDQLAFFKAVEGTIEYVVEEDTVSVSKGEASIDITFTIADYDSVLKEDYTDIDSLTSAIKKADTKEITFTAEFVQEDKEWVCDNVGSKKFMKLYEYRYSEINLALTADMIAGFIDKTMSAFWLTSNGVYIDSDFIEYDYYFDSAVLDYSNRDTYVYYTLLKDGVVVYSSDTILFGNSTSITCKVNISDLDSGKTAVFEAGTYSIELRMYDTDELIDSQSVAVEVSPEPTPAPSGGGGNGGGGRTSPGEGVYFDYYDQSFKNYVIEADWFDYDDCMTGDYTYTTDVQTIAFSIQVTPDCNKSVTYFYAWTDQESSDAIKDALNNPLYTNTVSPTTYSNGTFYDLDYPVNGGAQKGYYMMVVSDANTGEIILYGYCEVA